MSLQMCLYAALHTPLLEATAIRLEAIATHCYSATPRHLVRLLAQLREAASVLPQKHAWPPIVSSSCVASMPAECGTK